MDRIPRHRTTLSAVENVSRRGTNRRVVVGGRGLRPRRATSRLSRVDPGPVSPGCRHSMALPRTDDELERALATLAESEGLSRQEIIRRAVLERYERAGHRARVDDSARRMVDRWADILDRLGSV